MNDPSSKLPVLLFGLLLALCATVCVAFLLGEIPVEEVSTPGGREQRTYLGHGVTHPVFPSMNHGGDGLARHGTRLWLAWVFGLLQLAVIMGCLALGVRHLRHVRGPLLAIGGGIGLIMTMMVMTYRGYLDAATPALFMSLPSPTAWFLYGLWPAQFLMVLLYVVSFRHALVTPRDLERFQEILNASRADDTDG